MSVLASRAARAGGDDPVARVPMRATRCYHCGADMGVSVHAQTGTCRVCHRPLTFSDVRVKMVHWGGVLASCGSILIEKRARSIAKVCVAVEGVTILGEHDGLILSGGPVRVGDGAVLRGGVLAPEMAFGKGAVVEGGPFRVPCDPIGRLNPDRAALLVSKGRPLPTLDELRQMPLIA
ncbi:MAG: polymer-forming cytoskeletal protein [Planctomycetota bacterium]